MGSTVDAGGDGRAGLEQPAEATRTAAEPLRVDPTSNDAPADERLAAPLQTRDRDRYEIVGEHGRGGLGRVFRARDKELGRDIAVKELLERGSTSEVRFLREALITARLEHPGIVPVHEAGRWPDGTPFYAMKLVSGSPLKALIERAETLEQRLGLVPNVIAVADAIAYAHDRKIIHRDLKPSNVIVGDFGETVVIDWGLAKALDDTTTTIDSPYRGSQGHELTASGSVLGTPAYMAPEQYKGLADEKTDIYALGGILFHVLTGRSPHRDDQPAHYTNVADVFSRETPRDLVAIAQRALAKEPAKRYRSAKAFADDLRRYLQGLAVDARRYSATARLGRFLARHRAASLVSGVASLAIITTLILALVKIDRERDDAVNAEQRAESATDELVLEHAALFLHTDPSAALATVRRYHGQDTTRRQLIEAEAVGRGVGELVTVHSDTVVMASGNADGSIVSICADGRVALTSGDRTITLADDDGYSWIHAYAPSKRLLVYLDLDMKPVALDVATRVKTPLGNAKVRALAMSPDDTKFATLSVDGVLTVWSAAATPVSLLTRRMEGWTLVFPDPDHVIVSVVDHYTVASLTGSPDIVVASSFHLIDGRDGLVVTANKMGMLVAYRMTGTLPIASESVCRGAVTDFSIIPNKRAIAFGCEDGLVGMLQLGSSPSVMELFRTKGAPTAVTSSFDGRVVSVISDSTTAYVHDLERSITSSYEGQAARLTSISPPSSVYPELLTGDVVGTVRRWNVRPPAARRLVHIHADAGGFAPSPDGRTIVVPATDNIFHIIDTRTKTITTRPGHPGGVNTYRFSNDGRYFITGGNDGTVRIWSGSTLEAIRTLQAQTSRIQSVAVVGETALAIGNDGRLLQWALTGDDVRELFSTRYPLISLQVFGDSQIVVSDVRGNVWIVRDGSTPHPLRVANGDVVQNIDISGDDKLLAIGTQSGMITVVRLWDFVTILETSVRGAVRSLSFSSDGTRILIATDDRDVRMIRLSGAGADRWTEVTIDARHATFSPDGRYVGILARDGGVWLNSLINNTWRYARDHQEPRAINGGFSVDGRGFVTLDRSGGVIERDVAATMN